VELAQRIGERLQRALRVGLHQQVQRRDLAALHHREDVFEASAATEHHRVALRGDLAAMRTRFGNRARDLVGRRHAQLLTATPPPPSGTRPGPTPSPAPAGPASETCWPSSSNIARTPPPAGPAPMMSPTLNVPSSTSAVTTGPRP